MRRDGEGLRTIYPGLHPGQRYYATLWLQKALKGRNILARGRAPGIESPQFRNPLSMRRDGEGLRTIYPGLHPGLRYYATLWLQKALKGRNILARGTAPGFDCRNFETSSRCDVMERGLRTIYPGLHPGLRYYATLWLQKALKGRNILARGRAPGFEVAHFLNPISMRRDGKGAPRSTHHWFLQQE